VPLFTLKRLRIVHPFLSLISRFSTPLSVYEVWSTLQSIDRGGDPLFNVQINPYLFEFGIEISAMGDPGESVRAGQGQNMVDNVYET
jgi:hypothetical protein